MAETRKLGYRETIQKVFHDNYRCSGMILQIVRITGPLEPEILRKAVSLLQKRHPLLRARFREDASAYHYDIDDFSGLSERQTLERVPLEVVERLDDTQCFRLGETEPLRNFDSPHGYLWRIVQVYGQHASELVFLFHHSISDGVSTMRFASDIFDLCGCIAEGKNLPVIETLPLLPCADAMLDRTPPGESTHNDLPVIPDDAVTHWRFESPAPLAERSLRNIYRQIEKDDIARFMARCKKEGVSSTAAFTAIIMQAMAPAGDAALNLSISSGISLRGLCSPEVGHEHFGCYINMVSTAFAFDPGMSVWDLARQSQKRLAMAVAAQQRQGFLPRTFHKAFVSGAMKQNLARATEEGVFLGGICYSNLGAQPYPRQYGPFEFVDLYGLICAVAGHYYLYHTTRSLHGKLSWDIAYTEPLVSRKTAEGIADRVIEAVLQHTCG